MASHEHYTPDADSEAFPRACCRRHDAQETLRTLHFQPRERKSGEADGVRVMSRTATKR